MQVQKFEYMQMKAGIDFVRIIDLDTLSVCNVKNVCDMQIMNIFIFTSYMKPERIFQEKCVMMSI